MASPTPLDSNMINILLTSFPGLGLPTTLCIPVSSNSTVAEFTSSLGARLPSSSNRRLILTTANNKELSLTSQQAISTLLTPCTTSSTPADSTPPNAAPQLLTLRLSAPLCGGKGGFGSQLRAAGGRMSSRKKRGANEAAANGSNRNLDGRRLRTVTEAKALAEYLALKPEMDKKEKEERRQKWEAVVEAVERKQEEILSGKAGKGKGRGDAEWLEQKEEAEAKIREAVERAVREGLLVGAASGVGAGIVVGDVVGERNVQNEGGASEDDGDEEMESSEDDNGEGPSTSSKATTPDEAPQRNIFGWDEEEDDDDDEEHDSS